MEWLPLLGALGIGSILSAVIQWVLVTRNQNKRDSYKERKEAYIGLIEAWVRQENHNFDDISYRDVGHWTLRCELVASNFVFDALEQWQGAEPGSEKRIAATNHLKAMMRNDLRG